MRNNNILLIFIFSLLTITSCKNFSKNKPIEQKECSINLLQNSQNKITDGCEFNHKTTAVFSESSGVVSVISSTGFCTGTFITEHIVLTAAHCFNLNKLNKNTPDMYHEIGQTFLVSSKHHYKFSSYAEISPDVKTKTKSIIIHPYYLNNCKDDSHEYQTFNKCNFADLALIITEKPAHKIQSSPVPISTKLNNQEPIYFVGYGKFHDQDQSRIRTKRWGIAHLHPVDVLAFLSIPFGTSRPLEALGTFFQREISPFIPNKFHEDPRELFLFAEGTEHGICQGDSGGPIFIKDQEHFYTIGVVHANEGEKEHICRNKKSINTYIEPFYEWISAEARKINESVYFLRRK